MEKLGPAPENLVVFAQASDSSIEFDISDPDLVRTLDVSQREHFWFQARNRQILAFLREDGVTPPARILEAGCGMGVVLSALAGAGYAVTGVEMHLELARRAAEINPASPIFAFDLRSPPPEFLQRPPVDAVAVFDVIEHLDDPAAFLTKCAALVRPGGLVVGTVPAVPALWTDYDVFAGHRSRFSRATISNVVARANLTLQRAAFFFQTLLPPLVARRLLIRSGDPSDVAHRRATHHLALDAPAAPINSLLGALCTAERGLRRFAPLDRIPGTSIWFSARVPD